MISDLCDVSASRHDSRVIVTSTEIEIEIEYSYTRYVHIQLSRVQDNNVVSRYIYSKSRQSRVDYHHHDRSLGALGVQFVAESPGLLH